MKRSFLIAVLLALNSFLPGCVSPTTGKLDPATTQNNIDLLVDVVEAYAAVAATGKNYDNIIRYAETLRRLNDLPATRALLAQLQQGNTTVPTQPSK